MNEYLFSFLLPLVFGVFYDSFSIFLGRCPVGLDYFMIHRAGWEYTVYFFRRTFCIQKPRL